MSRHAPIPAPVTSCACRPRLATAYGWLSVVVVTSLFGVTCSLSAIAMSGVTNRQAHIMLVRAVIVLGASTLVAMLLCWLVALRIPRSVPARTDPAGADRRPDRLAVLASHHLTPPLDRARAVLAAEMANPAVSMETHRLACQQLIALNDRQRRVVGSLLLLARADRGLESSHAVDLALITDRVLSRYRIGYHDRHLRLTDSISPAVIQGDSALATHLIERLLDNAFRHNFPGGAVEITTGLRAERPYVTVVNTGPVVPAGTISCLGAVGCPGEPGYRDRQSTGLGLSIIQSIASAHRATVTAVPLGKGGLQVDIEFPAEPVWRDRHGQGLLGAVRWWGSQRRTARTL